MKSEVVGLKESGELLKYQTGKSVRNWARTFECRPERFYVPQTEGEVVEVLSAQIFFSSIACIMHNRLTIDREPCSEIRKNNSDGRRGAFALGYLLFLRMDDVS